MQLENLARAGAFDALEGNRARVFAASEQLLRRAQAEAEERGSGQISLFGGAPAADALRLPDIPDWPELERLSQEAEAVGFHLSAHPLDAYKAVLKKLGVLPSALLLERARGGVTRAKLAGTVTAIRQTRTRTGSRMAWVTMSDAAGAFEVTCFSEVLAAAREDLAEGAMLLVTADLRLDGEALRLTAQEVVKLDEAARSLPQELRLWLDRPEAVEPVRDLLQREGRGKGRVVLLPRLAPGVEVEMALPGGWNVSPRLAQAMKVIPGVAQVEAA
jgi:DNA polymerase-3 subunit alpha